MIKVKLCGMNDSNIIDHCCNKEYNPDFLVFVFFNKSPRNISYAQAKEFKQIIGGKIPKVSVTVNSNLQSIEKIISNLEPDYLQLHGNENLEYIKEVKKEFNVKIIKAIRIKDRRDIELLANYDDSAIDYFLFDTYTKEYGGSGLSFDWKILDQLNTDKSWFLSGGINLNNILLAIKSLQTRLFDISSGIEARKGVKDIEKIDKLLNFINDYNRNHVTP